MGRFDKIIKEIHDNNDFFEIDYNDVLNNFDTDELDEKVKVSMQLSLVNVAFLDAIRGLISRPRFLDKIISIYRKEFLEDVKYRVENDNKDNIQ